MQPRDWLAYVAGHDYTPLAAENRHTQSLPRFQSDGARRLLSLLERVGGALLADDVGLGKTHTGAAVVRTWLERGENVVVIAPAVVRRAWRRLLPDVVPIRSFAALSRSGFEARQPSLIIVDEAHRLRNPRTLRYARIEAMARSSAVLLISATPLHNHEGDVRTLLGLLLGERPRQGTPCDELTRALARVTVRRTRWTVQNAYRELDGDVPRRRVRVLRAPSPSPLLLVELPALLEAAFPDVHIDGVRGLVASVLARRFESSAAAAAATLERCRNFLLRSAEAARVGRTLDRLEFSRLFGRDPDWQGAQQVLPFLFRPGHSGDPAHLSRCAAELDDPIAELRDAPEPKLERLKAEIGKGRKIVIMSAFADTAHRIEDELVGSRTVLVTGAGAWSGGRRLSRRDALARFAPRAQGQTVPAQAQFDVLIATDVLGEGVNLQDASCLVHFDRPWNPVVAHQRVGRIDRMGSRHAVVEEWRFAVPDSVESMLGIEEALRRKDVVRQAVLGRDQDPIGIDLAGFLLAFSGPPGRGNSGVLGSHSGWLFAFAVDERVRLVSVGCALSDALRVALEGEPNEVTVPSADVELEAWSALASCLERDRLEAVTPGAPLDAVDSADLRRAYLAGGLSAAAATLRKPRVESRAATLLGWLSVRAI